MTYNQVIDKLYEELSGVQALLRGFWEQANDPSTSEATRRRLLDVRIPDAEINEQELLRKLTMLEDCEHPNCEDTGGPDGSQQCQDCGRVL